MWLAIALLIVLILVWFFRKEGYRSCSGCRGGAMPSTGVVRLNPFLPPYSSESCVDNIYVISKDTGVDIGTDVGPLTHLNTPDHVVLTN
jgi:hypothetical protein